MPVEVGIWRMGENLSRLQYSRIESEAKLEDALTGNLSVLSPGYLLIGRQVPTAFGKFIDILAMTEDGNLAVIELKRSRTPREVVAQLLDYACWVQDLSYDDISEIYLANHGVEFEKGFDDYFDAQPPEKINQEHELLVVAAELDPSSERVIAYLSENYGVPINAVFFRYFEDGGNCYLTRSWLVDPDEVEAKSATSPSKRGGKREPWNGQDYYVSFGDSASRNWEDARKHGFICAGGGKWYSQTLYNLQPGHRVFVNIPKTGYVGIGTVKEVAVPARRFTVIENDREVPFMEAQRNATYHEEHTDDELCEHFVRVDWIKTVPTTEAFWEKGLFAKQHSACKLRNRFTIEKLTEKFGLES